MSVKILRVMADYHAWANRAVIQALTKIPDENYYKDVRIPMRTIHGTMNHIVCAEELWMSRLTNRSTDIKTTLWASEDALAWHKVFADRNAVNARIEKLCAEWSDLVHLKDKEWLVSSFSYTSTYGDAIKAVRSNCLMHVFNHGTHHRGQITAALTIQGHPWIPLDMPMMKGSFLA